MDLAFIQKIIETGVIQWLFILIVVLFIWKWIPFIVDQFTKIHTNFLIALDKQQAVFKETLNTISSDFIKRSENSEAWHKEHQKELTEIKDILKNK
jgi:hypothetical protein